MIDVVSPEEKKFAAICYWGNILWFIPALIIFLLKKDESLFIKKHAAQSLGLSAAIFVISILLVFVSIMLSSIGLWLLAPIVGLLQLIVNLVWLVYSVVMGVKVYKGEDADLPYITDMLKEKALIE